MTTVYFLFFQSQSLSAEQISNKHICACMPCACDVENNMKILIGSFNQIFMDIKQQ